MPQGKSSKKCVQPGNAQPRNAQRLFSTLSKPLLFCAIACLSACSVASTAMPQASESVSRSSNLDSSNPDSSNQALSQAIPAEDSVDYQTYELPQATMHVVTIDPQGEATLSLAVADQLETVAAIAQKESQQQEGQNVIAAINAGFFDPQNGKTTSHLISQGEIIGNPADNERLMDNPSLQSYLPSILDRSEFRQYQCVGTDGGDLSRLSYAIAQHSSPIPTGCQINFAVGAGPQLLPQDTATAEAFTDYENGELIRDAIGSMQPNARSAIGIVSEIASEPQKIIFLMAAQRPDAPGLTLSELSDFAKTLGIEALLNLDGGSSSTLYYDGQTYPARLDSEGNPIERPVKSVLIVK